MKKSTYRIIDVALLTIIACVLEALNVVFRNLLGEMFTISITLVMTLIVMFRHNGYALVTAALGGVTYCLVSQKGGEYYLIYGVGNAFSLLNLLWFRFLAKKEETVAKSKVLCVLFVLTAFVCVNLFRTLLALPFNEFIFLPQLQIFFFADLLNLVFAVIIILIARKRPSFLKNQYEFLLEFYNKESNESFKSGNKADNKKE